MNEPLKPITARRKQWQRLRALGYTPMVSAEPVQRHLEYLTTRLTEAEISRRSGVPAGTLHSHLHGEYPRIRREIAAKLLAVRFGPEDLTPEERVRGAKRIYQGLIAMGFTTVLMSQTMGLSVGHKEHKISSLPNINLDRFIPSKELYRDMIRMSEKLECTHPSEYGILPRAYNGNKAKARHKGWAPVTAWDYETIHEADAWPDWTGCCGEPKGWQAHMRIRTPVCPRCKAAKAADNRERRSRKVA